MDLATVMLAIQLSAPLLPEASVNAYGKMIYDQSVKLNQDPLITIAIIKHESKWNSSIISDDRYDYGLMQIRAMYYHGPSVNLLNPWTNITVGSYWIKSSFDFCQKQLGREPQTQEWLSCFQGTCRLSNKWCSPTKMTDKVERYASCLQRNVFAKMSVEDCDVIYKKQ